MLNYDGTSEPIIKAEYFYKRIENLPKTCLSFFSKKLLRHFVEKYNPEIVGELNNSVMDSPVYKVNFEGEDVLVVQASIGAPAMVCTLEETVALTGIENFVLMGCCGCLDNKIEDYGVIIPTSAIRDEGTSYHYIEPADEIEIEPECVAVAENVVKSLGINYYKGKTWTTDAILRETKNKVQERRNQGAITVDMECSAVAVVCKKIGVNFAQIFYAADNLDGEEYDVRSLGGIEIDKADRMIPIGLKCAIELKKHFEK